MRWIFAALLLCGFSLIIPKHDTTEKVDAEFQNIEHNLQSQGFEIITTTESLSKFRDGEFKIFASTTVTPSYVSIMLRMGNDLYSVRVSCITVRR